MKENNLQPQKYLPGNILGGPVDLEDLEAVHRTLRGLEGGRKRIPSTPDVLELPVPPEGTFRSLGRKRTTFNVYRL
jgi:hypothetical protein